MARLSQIGFELQSVTAGVEWDTTTGSPSINTSIVRSGAASLRCNPTAATAYIQADYTNDTNVHYIRAYIYIVSSPAALTDIIANGDNADSYTARIRLATNNTLELWSDVAKIGSSSTGLMFNTWYRVELSYADALANNTAVGLLNGVQFATGNGGDNGGNGRFRIGIITATTADVYFDDIAANDSTGTSQNNFPGEGKILHLKPNAAGDINGFTVQIGGIAGSANNFTRVQEVTPDNATSYNGAALLNAEDLFNCDNFTGGAFGAINVVAIGARMADLVSADATAGLKLEVIKTSGGTKSQSANIVPNSTTFITNKTAVPRTYPLITYADPDSVPWGQSTLDSMQIGYTQDVAGVQTIAVSTVWASVEYTPVTYGTTTSTSSTSASTFSTSSTSSSISSTSSSISSTSNSTSTSSTSSSISSTSSSTSSTSSSISSTSASSTSASTSISSTSSSISSTSFSSTSQSSTSSSSSISSTSSSISSTSSSISSTSASTSSTSQSSTSSSSSTSTTAIELKRNYRYEDDNVLDSDNANIDNPFTSLQVARVLGDDGDYMIKYGSEYIMSQYKYKHINNTDACTFTWKGRSTYDTRQSPVYLQIFNQGNLAVSTYYFDASATGITNDAGAWTTTSNAFDGNTGTSAGRTGTASLGANYLEGGGTTAPSSGNTITQVRARFYGTDSDTAVRANIFTAARAESLGVAVGASPGSYIVLSTPSGGWSWPVLQALDVVFTRATGLSSATAARVEIEVTSGAAGAWETLARETRIPADTDYVNVVTQSTNMSNYYDSNNTITFRSYQQVI